MEKNGETMKYDLEERLAEYSVRIINTVEELPNTRAGNRHDVDVFVTSIKTAEKKQK